MKPKMKYGFVILVFVIIVYQASLFVHQSAVLRIEANMDKPDTVYITKKDTVKKITQHSDKVNKVRSSKKRYENFKFDPNTATLEEFVRLGFSEKQAQSIINYRAKGGRFRRKSDFAKSYVVSDTIYERLEPYIIIPKIDINTADTAMLRTLPGIGKWYAAKIVEYREQLQGFSYPEQLMDLWKFDSVKYNKIYDLIEVSKPQPYPLWELEEDELAKHPYIKGKSASNIVFFRDHKPKEKWTIDNLIKSHCIDNALGSKLKKCYIKEP